MSRNYIESKHDLNNDLLPKRSKRSKISGRKENYNTVNSDHMIYSFGTQIHFTASVTSQSIEDLIKVFTKVIKENIPKFGTRLKEGEFIDIYYIVDSPGGSVTDVLKFVDFLEIAKKKHPYFRFNSIITGRAASAGTIMSVVADERFMTKNAFAMIHELAAGIHGKYTDMKSQISLYEKMHTKLLNIYLDRNSKICKEELEKLLKIDNWFTAVEYKNLGFVDYIRGEEDEVESTE